MISVESRRCCRQKEKNWIRGHDEKDISSIDRNHEISNPDPWSSSEDEVNSLSVEVTTGSKILVRSVIAWVELRSGRIVRNRKACMGARILEGARRSLAGQDSSV